MISSQYVYSAAAYNFGFTYRKHWFRNYLLVTLVIGFMFIHYWITLVPGKMSCWLRINCVNEDNQASSVYAGDAVPIQNPFNMTLMPVEFRRFLAILMTGNLLAVLGWEYFIVGHGFGKKMWIGLVTMIFGKEDEPEKEPLVVFTGDTAKSQDFKQDDP